MSQNQTALQMLKAKNATAKSLPDIKKSSGRDGITVGGFIVGFDENNRKKKGEDKFSFKTKDVIVLVTDVAQSTVDNEAKNPSKRQDQTIEDWENNKFVVVSKDTGKSTLLIPQYLIIDKKPSRDGQVVLTEGTVLKFGADSISGNLTMGSYVIVNNVRLEQRPSSEDPRTQGQSVMAIDSKYMGPYGKISNYSVFAPKGSSSYAVNARNFFVAALESMELVAVHKAVDKKYTPFLVVVSAANVRFTRTLPDDDSHDVPGLFEILSYGVEGTADFGPTAFIKKFKFSPKEEDGFPKGFYTEFFEGKISVTEMGVDPTDGTQVEYETVLQVNTYEFTVSEKNGKISNIADTKQIWPVTNRSDYIGVASLNAVDLLSSCENGPKSETPLSDSSGDIKRITKNTGCPYARICGGWFGYVQHTGFLVSKGFAKTLMRHMINDRNIFTCSVGLSKQAFDTRVKLLSKLTGTVHENILLNPDISDPAKASLNLRNPLNKSASVIKLLNEYEGEDTDKLIGLDNVEIACVLGRNTSDDYTTDLAEHILEEAGSVLFGVDYSLQKIFLDNYNYRQKPNETAFDEITGANEILLLIIFCEYIFTSVKGFDTGFGDRKKAYGDAVITAVTSIIQKKLPKGGDFSKKYVPGNFPALAKWFWLAFTLPVAPSTSKRSGFNITDEDNEQKIKKIEVPEL